MFLVIHLYTYNDPDMNECVAHDPVAIFDSAEKADAFIEENQNLKGHYRVPGLYAMDETGACGDLVKIEMPLNVPVIPESDFWWKAENPKPMVHFDYENMITNDHYEW